MSRFKFKRGINPAISLGIGIWSQISRVSIYFTHNERIENKQKYNDVLSSKTFYINELKPDIINNLNDSFNKSIREIWSKSLKFDVKILIFVFDKENQSLPMEQADQYRKFLKPYHLKMIKKRWKNLDS